MTTTKAAPELTPDGREYDLTEFHMDDIRLRSLVDLDVDGRHVYAGFIFTLKTSERFATLSRVAIKLVEEGRAERIGTPNWWRSPTTTCRAIGEVGGVPGRFRTPPGTVFEMPCETRDQREAIGWGIRTGAYELVGEPPTWWRRGQPTTTRPSNRPIGESWAAH